MKNIPNFTSQSGKTLVELIIVLVVGAILATFAIAQFGNPRQTLQRQNISHELKSYFERARLDSMKRRAAAQNQMASVVIDSATSFHLSSDLNQDGKLDAAETRKINFNSSGVKFVGDNLNNRYPVIVRFDQRGFITAVDNTGTTVNANFVLCKDCATLAAANAKNSDKVSVSPTGAILMMAGDVAVPTIKNPTVTSVDTKTQINQKLYIKPN